MNTLDFYRLVLPSTGRYCIAGIHQATQKIRQVFVDTLEDAVRTTEQFGNTDFINTYFAQASFKGDKRDGEHAQFMRSFYVDLDTKDVGGIKGYANKQDAFDALKIFCQVMGFPRPVVNDSGGGLHAYWPFTEDVPVAEWKELALKFKQLCYFHHLNTDPTVPADPPRLLRPVGTLNQKANLEVTNLVSGKPTPFESLKAIIETKFGEMPFELQAQAQPKRQLTEEERAVLGMDGLDKNFRKILDASLRDEGCPQIKECFETRATLDEPRWRAMLSIAQVCNDRDQMIHIVSEGYPDYDPAKTEAKANDTRGPYRCKTWGELNPKGCDNCPIRGKIVGPIALGSVMREPEQENTNEINAVDAGNGSDGNNVGAASTNPPEHIQDNLFPDLPEIYFKPFQRGPNGGIYVTKIEKGKDGKIIETGIDRVYPNDIFVVKLTQDGDSFAALVRVFLPHDGVKEFYVSLALFASPEKCKSILNANGVVAPREDMDKLLAYMTKWVQYLQAIRQAERLHQQFGWTDDMEGFVWGTQEFTARGILDSPSSTRTRKLAKAMVTTGDYQKWRDAFNVLGNPGFELHAFCAFNGFGSPLLALLTTEDTSGAVLSFQNAVPGTGKTLSLHVMSSIWGLPSEMIVKSSTSNGIYQRMSVMNSIPMGLDENTNMSGQAISELIYNSAHGSGKVRMEGASNVERDNQGHWKQNPVTTANTSTYQRLDSGKASSMAEKMRVIEVKLNRPELMTSSFASTKIGPVNENYGHAGPVFAQWLVGHKIEATKYLRKWQARFTVDFGDVAQYRYWSYSVASIFAGAEIAQIELDLHTIDIERVYQRVLKELKHSYNDLVSNVVAPYDVYGNFFTDNTNNMLVIRGSEILRGQKIAPTQTPRGPLVMRYEPDTQELAIKKQTFDEYCHKLGMNINDVKQVLKDKQMLKDVRRKRMDKGWQSTVGDGDKNINVMCYIFDVELTEDQLKGPAGEGA